MNIGDVTFASMRSIRAQDETLKHDRWCCFIAFISFFSSSPVKTLIGEKWRATPLLLSQRLIDEIIGQRGR